MIRIDDRRGSGEFRPLLVRLGAPCKIKRQRFADFSFYGNGPTGRVRIGIERKTISEICGGISDHRFTEHQLPGLLRTYDYVFVAIEGYTSIDRQSGILMQGRWSAGYGAFRHTYLSIKKFELTLRLKGSVHIEHTVTKFETAWFVRAVYDWFQEPWKKHKSVYTVQGVAPDAAILDRRTLKRRIAAQLPGVAWEYSARVDKYFPSVVEMVTADVSEWQRALKIKAGRKKASTIVRALHGKN